MLFIDQNHFFFKLHVDTMAETQNQKTSKRNWKAPFCICLFLHPCFQIYWANTRACINKRSTHNVYKHEPMQAEGCCSELRRHRRKASVNLQRQQKQQIPTVIDAESGWLLRVYSPPVWRLYQQYLNSYRAESPELVDLRLAQALWNMFHIQQSWERCPSLITLAIITYIHNNVTCTLLYNTTV